MYHLRGSIAHYNILYIYMCIVVIGRCRLTRNLLHVPRSISDDTIERLGGYSIGGVEASRFADAVRSMRISNN